MASGSSARTLVPAPTLALDGEPAVQRLDAVADVGQPAGTGAVRLEPSTVVLDDQAEPVARTREPYAGAVSAGVLGHIGERLAGYEVGRALHILREPLVT